MPRPIDAEELLEEMGAGCIPILEKGISGVTGDESTIKDYIDEAPTMTLEPEPMEWLSPAKPGAEAWRECSACGAEVEGIAFPFCPYCGRKARNGVKENA